MMTEEKGKENIKRIRLDLGGAPREETLQVDRNRLIKLDFQKLSCQFQTRTIPY